MSPLPNQHNVGLATESIKQDETFDYCCVPWSRNLAGMFIVMMLVDGLCQFSIL